MLAGRCDGEKILIEYCKVEEKEALIISHILKFPY
jgi:hypothetical protein